ncbi:hypothetical protein [Mesorhizobium sp. M0085]|uniref:hypothetical protein n=1 Tax=Mesorhizobium sp. M0085 TaxID=2956872 RepID=UPI00333ACCDE
MSTTERVKELLNGYKFTKAFVLDDAYDTEPEFSQLAGLVANDLPEQLEKLDKPLLTELNKVLDAEGIEQDDWETAITFGSFMSALWTMKRDGRLSDGATKSAFGTYEADVESKRAAIAPLLTFLKGDLGLTVIEAGRESQSLPVDTKVVFLDLFLGITDDNAARAEAADKIKELLRDMGDHERPVVVLMSSKTGEQLEDMAEDLRKRAGLMGAKFRVLSKDEFKREDAIGTVLRDLLAPLKSANTLGKLIDTWDEALKSLRDTIKNDLRALDLSDYAFLAKYRLEVEKMPLGAYLLEAYSDVMRYRLESSSELIQASAEVDALSFTEMPPAHFLPQASVNLLSHAVTFVNEDRITADGTTMANAADKLQLGDILAEQSALEDLSASPPRAKSIPVQVVISQICDLQQGKTDDIFLLEGIMEKRNWMETIKPVDTRVDCFLWRESEFTINWKDSNLKTWSKRVANSRLNPEKGNYRRFARLRALPALKAQQLFASRLTRIGTLASPHWVKPVTLTIDYMNEKKERVELFKADASEKLACVVNGAVLEGTTKWLNYVVFSRQFPRKLAAKLLDVVEQMHPSVRADLKEFASSEVALASLRQPCQVGKPITHKTLKIDLKAGAQPSAVVGISISGAEDNLVAA